MSEMLKQYTAIQFNFRGKVTKQLDATGCAMLKLWALKNTSGKSKTAIMELETNKIIMVVEGRGRDNFPKVYTTEEDLKQFEINLLTKY